MPSPSTQFNRVEGEENPFPYTWFNQVKGEEKTSSLYSVSDERMGGMGFGHQQENRDEVTSQGRTM